MKLYKNISQKKVIGIGVAACVLGLLLVTPAVHYRLGNLFFGSVPMLYNVDLAQFFYACATDPLIGTAPEFSHYQLSRTYFIQGFFNRSVEEALTEISLYPENKRTYYILGLTYGYMNREEEAIESFSEFITRYPDSWAARNDKAWLQFKIGDISGALETMEPVKNILNPWVQNTYGVLLLNSGRTAEAAEVFLIAERNAAILTEQGWGSAYPGNDPRIYSTGLEVMRDSVTSNRQLVSPDVPE